MFHCNNEEVCTFKGDCKIDAIWCNVKFLILRIPYHVFLRETLLYFKEIQIFTYDDFFGFCRRLRFRADTIFFTFMVVEISV